MDPSSPNLLPKPPRSLRSRSSSPRAPVLRMKDVVAPANSYPAAAALPPELELQLRRQAGVNSPDGPQPPLTPLLRLSGPTNYPVLTLAPPSMVGPPPPSPGGSRRIAQMQFMKAEML